MDALFRKISFLCIAVVAAAMVVHFLLFGLRLRKNMVQTVKTLSIWERLVHLGLTLTFLVLAGTGFWPALAHGKPLEGYLLMIHVTFGGVFAGCLAAMALTWAHENRFAQPDSVWLASFGGMFRGNTDLPATRFNGCDKVFFWTAALLGLVCAISMLVSMLPLFSSPCGLTVLNEVHRYSALALLLVVANHLYVTSVAHPGGLRLLMRGK